MPVHMERKKMTRQMYDTLKSHIMKERERKRQEQEADAAQAAKIRQERERKQKQMKDDQLTLDQTREQINALEAKLAELKTQKHELFSKLKKVLHEDDTRRQRNHQSEALIRVSWESVHSSAPPGVFIPVSSGQRAEHPHLLPPGIKRRTPSPTPPLIYHHGPYTETSKPYQYPPGRPIFASQPAVSHTVTVPSRVPAGSAFSSYPHFSNQPTHAGMLPQPPLQSRHHQDPRQVVGKTPDASSRQPIYPPHLHPPATYPSLVARSTHPDAEKYGIVPHVLHPVPGAPGGILPIQTPPKTGGGLVSGFPLGHPPGNPPGPFQAVGQPRQQPPGRYLHY